MDSISSVNTSTPLISIFAATAAASSTDALLAPTSNISTFGLFDTSSTMVELSAEGQLLSAVSSFQNQLQGLHPGTTTSGGGLNFGTDFASFAAEVQSFVDSFNSLQSAIANISNSYTFLGASITGATGLAQSLNAETQASFANGSSALTNLSQLGIVFQPPTTPGGGSSLSINLNTLQAAFNSDPAATFSLLASATNTFSSLANSFLTQTGAQSSPFTSQAQTSVGVELLINDLLSQAQNNGDLSGLLAIDSLTGTANFQQVMLAMNEFNFVSGLLG